MSTNDLPDWATVVARPDTIISGSPTLYSPGGFSDTFTMPTGVHILSIVLQDWPDVTGLLVQGANTGVVYLNINPSQSSYQHQYYALIPSGADTQVTVTVTASVAGNMWLTGVSDTVAVAVLPQDPTPWQAPNQPPMKFGFTNPATNGTAAVIAAPGLGKSIYLHTMLWYWVTVAANVSGEFEQTSGTFIVPSYAVVAGQPYYVDFKGAKLAPDSGIQFLATGTAAAGAALLAGSVTYSVY